MKITLIIPMDGVKEKGRIDLSAPWVQLCLIFCFHMFFLYSCDKEFLFYCFGPPNGRINRRYHIDKQLSRHYSILVKFRYSEKATTI